MKIKIEKVVFGGKGLSKIDGKVCFVPFTLPKEVVEVDIKKEKKNICEADALNIIEKSSYRIEPKCKYYTECGGCDFQHTTYENQLKLKEEILEETIKRTAKINKKVDKVIPSKNSYNYRNKVQFKSDGISFGFYKLGTNEIVDIDICEISDERINKLIPILKDFSLKNPSIEEVHIFYPDNNKPLLKLFLKEKISINTEKIENIFNGIGIYYNDKRIKLIRKSFTFYKVLNLNYRVSIDSFFQTNKYQIENLLNEVIEEIPENVSCIGDIYCGVGFFTLPASKKAKKTFGIEANKSAIKDADYNAKISNIKNVKFYAKIVEKSEDIIFGYNPEILIFDPPRTGISKNIIKKILKLKSLNKIIYVSCNPSTAARDINLLSERFKLTKVKLIDMFPQTHHIESIFVLERL